MPDTGERDSSRRHDVWFLAQPAHDLEEQPVRIGILTGGGDCPGLNAVIRSVVRTATTHHGSEVVGFRDGWRGLLENRTTPLDVPAVDGLLTRGGTTLGSARVAPEKLRSGLPRMRAVLAEHGIDVLIPIGGEGTLTAAHLLSRAGVPVVGIPKTIDNDIDGTDLTFGFDTAVSIATDAIDRLHTTAESHQRVLLVEVMGRHAGWIALHAGLASGAHLTLVPEEPFDLDEVVRLVRERFDRGDTHVIGVVAEGAAPLPGQMALRDGGVDEFGHRRFTGVAQQLGEELERRTGKEVRAMVLGHVQRGGTPTARDRWLATRFGLHAVDAVAAAGWGQMTALRGTDIVMVGLGEATRELKLVDPALYAEAAVFFG
jgi:6-phosphofructokinase 1